MTTALYLAVVLTAAAVIAATLGVIVLRRLRAEDRRLEELLADGSEPVHFTDDELDRLAAMLDELEEAESDD